MNDEFPSTPKEINRAKLALFTNEAEFIRSKEDASKAEKDWLPWADGRCDTLEELA